MAVIYYPKNQLVFIRDQQVSSSNYESVLLNCSPNTVLYFDTSSLMQQVNALLIPITASWAMTASVSQIFVTSISASWATQSLTSDTASFAYTASFALNANASPSASWASSSLSASYVGPVSPYQTISTSSTNWITCSFVGSPIQQIELGRTGSYFFTASNMPSSGQVSDIVLYISHSGTPNTSSLTWPSNWVSLGSTLPNFITATRFAVLWLHATDNGVVMGSFTSQ